MASYYKTSNEHYCKDKTPDSLYKIGMFAGMNRVTIKALRYYDEQKLLQPAFIDHENGYRYYVLSQVADLHQIIALRDMGFTIEEIRKIKEGKSEKDLLTFKKTQLLKQISELTDKLARVESYLSKEQFVSSAHVLIKTLPEVSVACMKVRLENYDQLFHLMPELGVEMEQLGCVCAVPDYCFTHYLEPGYKDEQILVEICQAVTEPGDDSDMVNFKKLEETEAACIFHKGSYSDFPKSYEIILNYIEENGYEICGNIRECYIDGVWNKDSSDDWLSEIQIPVKKISEFD